VEAEGKRRLEMRLEAYNAFNHANFTVPNNPFTSPLFGEVSSVIQSADPNSNPSPGRSVQLVGKFYF
jgi:hypothetical protein